MQLSVHTALIRNSGEFGDFVDLHSIVCVCVCASLLTLCIICFDGFVVVAATAVSSLFLPFGACGGESVFDVAKPEFCS